MAWAIVKEQEELALRTRVKREDAAAVLWETVRLPATSAH